MVDRDLNARAPRTPPPSEGEWVPVPSSAWVPVVIVVVIVWTAGWFSLGYMTHG